MGLDSAVIDLWVSTCRLQVGLTKKFLRNKSWIDDKNFCLYRIIWFRLM